MALTTTTHQETQPEQLATFAGGCFWCMEPPFRQLAGVRTVVSGYTGGTVPDPAYEEVCSGTTGHAEAVQIHFDPRQIGYDELLEIFWQNIDPTDRGGQFVDRGSQYRTAIFYHDQAQRQLAEVSKQQLEQSGRYPLPLQTEIVPAGPFYPAEAHHQDFKHQSPGDYWRYRDASGRDHYLQRVWWKKT